MEKLPGVSQLIDFLHYLSTITPLPIFVFIGAIVEEIVSPIPSPLVMTLTGALAKEQGQAIAFLFLLALIGTTGKTIASWIFYFLADKTEDFLTGRFGKLIGIEPAQIEKLGQFVNRSKHPWLILILLRAFPAMPSLPVSVLCGLIKLNLKLYLFTTFVGFTLRNFFFLMLGYQGITAITSSLDSLESILKFVIVGVAGLALVVFYYLRSKGKTLADFLPKDNQPSK